jgi:hypothetical protein
MNEEPFPMTARDETSERATAGSAPASAGLLRRLAGLFRRLRLLKRPHGLGGTEPNRARWDSASFPP